MIRLLRSGPGPGSRDRRSGAILTGLEIYSPYQNTELTEGAVYDCGDLELAIGDSKAVLAQIEETAGKILDDGKLPFMIGGEHLVTLGAVRAGGGAISGSPYHSF